jgi:hypothetical protein
MNALKQQSITLPKEKVPVNEFQQPAGLLPCKS